MNWEKKGLIFCPDNNFEWMKGQAKIPFAQKYDDQTVRIYFCSSDQFGQSHPTFIDADINAPENILFINPKPLLELGSLGTFDESGILPSWIIDHDEKKFMYYIGYNLQATVAYRLSIGLAISEDGGNTFYKYSQGPICERGKDEPFFNTAPCVMIDEDGWKMWYVSCTGWDIINGHPEPYYNIKYAVSEDGINWIKTNKVCIGYDEFTQAIGRPCVLKENGIYKMYYSHRNAHNYRIDRNRSYRIGYAESENGIDWVRMDDKVGIEKSETGWDSEMIEYCHLYQNKGKKFLLYNGNGFGKSGFGYAVLKNE